MEKAKRSRAALSPARTAYSSPSSADPASPARELNTRTASNRNSALFLLLAVRVFNSRAGEAGSAEEGELYAVRAGDKAARDLFAFSIGYLAALFAALIVEHAFGFYWAFPGLGA